MLLFVLTRGFLIVLELIVLTETVNDVTRLPKQFLGYIKQECYLNKNAILLRLNMSTFFKHLSSYIIPSATQHQFNCPLMLYWSQVFTKNGIFFNSKADLQQARDKLNFD